PDGKPLIVGLTGGMGCGKSTAAAMFAARGFRRHDSDQFIRDVLYRDPEIIASVAARFGPDMVAENGTVRRDRIAAAVFGNDEALAWLERLLHPRLYDEWRRSFAEPGAPWIVEVPLLFEKGLENWFDFTIC